MSPIYYATAYKNKIINLLLENKNLIKLINPSKGVHEDLDVVDVLRGGEWIIDGQKYIEQGHIYDYNFTDGTTHEEKTFIFVETDIKDISKDIFAGFNLYICLFTSKELVRITTQTVPTVEEIKGMGCYATSIGNRIDALGEIIDGVINGNSEIKGIGTVKPVSSGFWKPYSPNHKYYGRCLTYTITNLCKDDFDECDKCGN